MSLFIKNIFLVQLCLILAILYPTSLANLVVEVGTRHSHQTLLKNMRVFEKRVLVRSPAAPVVVILRMKKHSRFSNCTTTFPLQWVFLSCSFSCSFHKYNNWYCYIENSHRDKHNNEDWYSHLGINKPVKFNMISKIDWLYAKFLSETGNETGAVVCGSKWYSLWWYDYFDGLVQDCSLLTHWSYCSLAPSHRFNVVVGVISGVSTVLWSSMLAPHYIYLYIFCDEMSSTGWGRCIWYTCRLLVIGFLGKK